MESGTPDIAQGEFQGASSNVNSFSAIIGPLLMIQPFAVFTASDAPFYFLGIRLFVASGLSLICLFIVFRVVSNYGLTQLGKVSK